jgi:hypothetical protein
MREGGVDVQAACMVARDMGCDPSAAAPLVLAANAGFWRGYRKRKAEEEADRADAGGL